MTDRLYQREPYTTTFTADIIERVLLPGRRVAVVLNQTAFYPALTRRMPGNVSLVLPADKGQLNDVQVVQVAFRDEDGEILHVLADEIWQTTVEARIDTAHRNWMMRVHTAGHLLAHALGSVCPGVRVGIALKDQDAWLEMDRTDITGAQLDQAEAVANNIALANRAIQTASVDPEQARKLNFPVPANSKQPVQVINIEGVGVMACEGLHVARTGEVGLVKLLSQQTLGERLQVRFTCGLHALAEFRGLELCLAQIQQLAEAPTAQAAVEIVAGMRAELESKRSELASIQGKISGFEADALASVAEPIGPARLVRRVYKERDVADLRDLAHLITSRPGLVVMLGASGPKSQLVFARSANLTHDMTVYIRVAAQLVNSQGGGQPAHAETLPVRADEARIEAAIAKAAKLLQSQH